LYWEYAATQRVRSGLKGTDDITISPHSRKSYCLKVMTKKKNSSEHHSQVNVYCTEWLIWLLVYFPILFMQPML